MRRLTSQQKHDLMAFLIDGPGLSRARSRKKLLRKLGAKDGRALGVELLGGALQSRDAGDVEIALIISYAYGLTPEHLGSLLELVSADWHHSHEDVVMALDRLRAPEAVEALVHATQWVPDYLDYDECRALATKAIWALGKTAGSDAKQALVRLVDSDDEILRERATHVLQIRGELLEP